MDNKQHEFNGWRGWRPSKKHALAVNMAFNRICELFPNNHVSVDVYVAAGTAGCGAIAYMHLYVDGMGFGGGGLRVMSQPIGRGSEFPPEDSDDDPQIAGEFISPGPVVAAMVNHLPRYLAALEASSRLRG